MRKRWKGLKWPLSWYLREAWSKVRYRRIRRERREADRRAADRDAELWHLLDEEQRREDDRLIARICAALEDAGYNVRPR
jgi:hypothetical protein